MILIPPAITPVPGAAVEIIHQQSAVVAGIATTPSPLLKAPPLNPPRKGGR